MTKLKTTFVSALLSIASYATASTELYNFDDNQIPNGWTIRSVGPGSNYGISNGRFYSGSVDSSALLGTNVSLTSEVNNISFDWDGNLVKTYWGSQGQAHIFDGSGQTLGFARWRTTTYLLGTNVEFVLSNNAQTSYTYADVPEGEYSFQANFARGEIQFTGSIAGQTQFERTLATSTLDFSLVRGYNLYTYQTIGPDVWMDNLSVQISAVPEPATAGLLLAGILVVVGHRLKKTEA